MKIVLRKGLSLLHELVFVAPHQRLMLKSSCRVMKLANHYNAPCNNYLWTSNYSYYSIIDWVATSQEFMEWLLLWINGGNSAIRSVCMAACPRISPMKCQASSATHNCQSSVPNHLQIWCQICAMKFWCCSASLFWLAFTTTKAGCIVTGQARFQTKLVQFRPN